MTITMDEVYTNPELLTNEALQATWKQVGRNLDAERLKALWEGTSSAEGPAEVAYMETLREMKIRKLPLA